MLVKKSGGENEIYSWPVAILSKKLRVRSVISLACINAIWVSCSLAVCKFMAKELTASKSETAGAAGEITNAEHLQTTELEDDVVYKMTWRTYMGSLSLALAFSINTFTSAGPPSTIAYQVATFPLEAANGSWIANAPLFPLIALTPIFGTLSDRYGKKWFLACGCLFGVVGSAVAGSAKNLGMIIAGQTISGVATSLLQLTNPAAMEIVAAKNRPAAMGFQELVNGSLGATLSVVVCMSYVF